MQTIELQYKNPCYPENGYGYLELISEFIFNAPANALGAHNSVYLSKLRSQMEAAWYRDADELQSYADDVLELDQEKGIVRVNI